MNGPFTLVLDQEQPDRITFFCPIDPDKLHKFYLNGIAKPLDDGQDPKRTYHFELPANGLDIYARKHPYIDQCFRDITFKTDLWQKTDYFITLDLPVPDSIGFIPPEQPITFKRGKKEGSMPRNNVLEYKITDPDDVHMLSKQGKMQPRPLKTLSEEYAERCRSYKANNAHQNACSDFEELFKSWDEQNVKTFLFGVGVDENLPEVERHAHAVKFYNESILTSFPHAKEEQELDSIGNPAQRAPKRGAMLMPAVWDPTDNEGLFRTVSAIMDCEIIGPHVKVTGP